MKRVVISPEGLKVSRPGVDVDTAALSDLLLSIDFTFGQLLAHGVIALSPTGAGLNRSGTIPIGPYSSPPQVFAWGVDAGGGWEAVPAVKNMGDWSDTRYWDWYNVSALFEKWSMAATTTMTELSIHAFEDTRQTRAGPGIDERYSQRFGNTVPPYAVYLLYRSRLS